MAKNLSWEGSIYEPTSGSDPIRCYGELPKAEYGLGYKGPGWYYWNKTWDRLRGPFASLEACRKALGRRGK